MAKIMPAKKMDGYSLNLQQELLGLLKKKAPDVFVEGKIDPARLKQTLGEEINLESERYGLNWAGKSECFRHIQETTTATLKSIRNESVDFDKTENIFIEGDNLEVLKILQKTYQNKIKMIYIDPPYNTGSDSFIYPDRYKEEKEDYELRAGIKDAEGLLTKDGFWRKNSKDAGYFHSNWLSMMYPRLFLAKNLLREDGIIFVSIDDNEVQNLRMIMDEIFGEENFVAQIVWEKMYTTKNDAAFISASHEYVICFCKNIANLEIGLLARTEEMDARYKNVDNDPRGAWKPIPLYAEGESKNGRYIIKAPNGKEFEPRPDMHWRYSEENMQVLISDNRIYFGKDGNSQPNLKRFLNEVQQGAKPRTLWPYEDVGSNDSAKKELKTLFAKGEPPFDFPKPTTLINRMAVLATKADSGDMVLDFFAGSGTTAHAVMVLNAEDGGNRKFICVQLAEPCEKDSEAFKAGFKTIADIGKERIRRAAKKIKKESSGKLDFDGKKLDLGFKVFKLEQSNFKQWRENVKEPTEFKKQLWEMVDNVKKGAGSEDMLFEIILKNSRFDLNVNIEKKSFDGVDYYVLADGLEIICLAEKITKKLAEKVLKDKPERFTCLDVAFKNNDQLKTNTALQMEAEKIEFKVI